MNVSSDGFEFIDNSDRLDAYVSSLYDAESLACDTEFVRTNTFWPKLCLIQVSTGGAPACLDVIACSNSHALKRLLLARPPVWVMHAAKQDLEALQSTFGTLPAQLFDTQIAAGLLGHPPQIGYANLVEAVIGARLDKGQTRTDWARRPLTDAQLRYAADDVIHLLELRDKLTERLTALGRQRWVEEDSSAMLDPSLYAAPPNEAWRRVPSIAYLPLAEQARARALSAWREIEATQRNRPRKWILSDAALLRIARDAPASVADLGKIEDLPPAVMRKHGETLLAECNAATRAADQGNVDFTPRKRPAPTDDQALKKLAAVVRTVAERHDIAPELLATRRDLAAILRGKRDGRPLSGWRGEVLGDVLLAAVD